jgi:hypothetical protein
VARELERYCLRVWQVVWENLDLRRDELGGVVEMLQRELFGQGVDCLRVVSLFISTSRLRLSVDLIWLIRC